MKKWKSGVWILLFFSASVYAESGPAELQKKVIDSISLGQQAQAEADAWAEEKEMLLEKIRQKKRKKIWLAHQLRKYDIYLAKQAESMEALEKRKGESDEIRMDLEPWLEEIPARLAKAVGKDLPFLKEERQKRLDFLQESLDDYRITPAEKTARIFEALRIETAYGYGKEIRDEMIRLNGKEVRVKVLRLGRVCMYFESPDGKESGWFNRQKNEWEILAPEHRESVRHAFAVAEKKQVPVFTKLPVGRGQ